MRRAYNVEVVVDTTTNEEVDVYQLRVGSLATREIQVPTGTDTLAALQKLLAVPMPS